MTTNIMIFTFCIGLSAVTFYFGRKRRSGGLCVVACVLMAAAFLPGLDLFIDEFITRLISFPSTLDTGVATHNLLAFVFRWLLPVSLGMVWVLWPAYFGIIRCQ